MIDDINISYDIVMAIVNYTTFETKYDEYYSDDIIMNNKFQHLHQSEHSCSCSKV